jgi:hypothetical protein
MDPIMNQLDAIRCYQVDAINTLSALTPIIDPDHASWPPSDGASTHDLIESERRAI